MFAACGRLKFSTVIIIAQFAMECEQCNSLAFRQTNVDQFAKINKALRYLGKTCRMLWAEDHVQLND